MRMSWKKLLKQTQFLMEELQQIYHDKSVDPEDFKRHRNDVLYFHDQVVIMCENDNRMRRSIIISVLSYIVYFCFAFLVSASIASNTISLGMLILFIINSLAIGYDIYLTLKIVKKYQSIMKAREEFERYYDILCEEIGFSVLDYVRADKGIGSGS